MTNRALVFELNTQVTIEAAVGGFILTYPKIVGWETQIDPIVESVKEVFTSHTKMLKKVKELYTLVKTDTPEIA